MWQPCTCLPCWTAQQALPPAACVLLTVKIQAVLLSRGDGVCLQVGVGAFVLNERREVLVVQEKMGPLRDKGVWKMPTGLVQVGWAMLCWLGYAKLCCAVLGCAGVDQEWKWCV